MSAPLVAIDINKERVESGGVAYYRLPKDLKDFLAKCELHHGIVGFEYEAGSWNFGVILQKDREKSV